MASFDLYYEESEDVLEVTFVSFDENFARTIPLNEQVELLTDTAFAIGWGLRFYGYATLLQVGEIDLDGLEPLSAQDRRRVLGVLGTPPISHFLELMDSEGRRALIKAPSLQHLLEA